MGVVGVMMFPLVARALGILASIIGILSVKMDKEEKMDQSISNKAQCLASAPVIPKRSFSVEFAVGVFTIVGLVAVAYLAVGLGGLELSGANKYEIVAEFDNVAGLQPGASVEIAGVQIGEVSSIEFSDPMAKIHMRINRDIRIKDDDIPMIRTKGIIGDRYVKISRGSSDKFVEPGSVMTQTESVVDFEDIIGKFIHRMDGGDKES